jgi:hypothetical protein
MLRKLLKYEFKATARILLPLYAALIGFSIINKFFIGFGNSFDNMEGLGKIPAIVSMIGYVATMVAVVVVTFFIIIQRFYKNLLGDEGYLMNTLPVSLNKNILSKLLIAIIWNIISAIVAIFSILIMAYRPGVFEETFRSFGGFSGFIANGYDSIGISIYIIPLEFIILMLIGIARATLLVYASMSLGHLASKRKVLSSFGAFIVLNMIQNAITGIVPSYFAIDDINFSTMGVAPIHKFLIFGIISALVFSAIFYAVSNYILKNKLNLE